MKIGDKLIVVDDILGHEIPINTEVIVVEMYESNNILVQVIDGIRHRVIVDGEYKIK